VTCMFVPSHCPTDFFEDMYLCLEMKSAAFVGMQVAHLLLCCLSNKAHALFNSCTLVLTRRTNDCQLSTDQQIWCQPVHVMSCHAPGVRDKHCPERWKSSCIWADWLNVYLVRQLNKVQDKKYKQLNIAYKCKVPKLQ